jgi:hypothetical protein
MHASPLSEESVRHGGTWGVASEEQGQWRRSRRRPLEREFARDEVAVTKP